MAMILLVIMGMMWGLQFSMLKLATQSGHSDINILMLSLTLLSVIYLVILVIRKQLFKITRSRLIFLVVNGFLGYVIPLAASLKAAPHISVGVLTLIISLTPVVTISVAVTLRTEPVSPGRIFAVLLGLIAVVLVLAPELDLPAHGSTYWIGIAMIVPLSYGIESIYVAGRWPKGLSPLQVVAGEAIVAALLVLPFFVIFGEAASTTISWSMAELAIIIFVITGAVEVFLYFFLIEKTGGVFVSFGTFVSLFAGIFWGMIIFSESHSQNIWLAVVFLVLALIFSCMNSKTNS